MSAEDDFDYPETEDDQAPEADPFEDEPRKQPSVRNDFVRSESEDDDGYDPYSDRPARPEPLFERDPWN